MPINPRTRQLDPDDEDYNRPSEYVYLLCGLVVMAIVFVGLWAGTEIVSWALGIIH